MNQLTKAVPTLNELIQETETTQKENAFMVLCNQAPPVQWLKEHPMIPGYKYLPIERVEYLLSRVFTKWWVEVKDVIVVANSVVVTIRLNVINPITGDISFQEGLGAAPIQTDKGAAATDWSKVKSDGVMKAAPSAESFAIKDAAEKFGKLFGKDLARKEQIVYDGLLKTKVPELEELQELYEMKKGSLTVAELADADRIIKNKEITSYFKLQTLLKSK